MLLLYYYYIINSISIYNTIYCYTINCISHGAGCLSSSACDGERSGSDLLQKLPRVCRKLSHVWAHASAKNATDAAWSSVSAPCRAPGAQPSEIVLNPAAIIAVSHIHDYLVCMSVFLQHDWLLSFLQTHSVEYWLSLC